jgi:hypothetical protein
MFSRQLFLGEVLDTDNIQANYDAGVLTLRIPVLEQAKPRRIEIGSGKAKALTSRSVTPVARRPTIAQRIPAEPLRGATS